MELVPKDFDISTIPEKTSTGLPKTMRVILYGKTQCGKSHCMRSLLYTMRKRFDMVYLFSATASLQEDTYSYIPKSNQSEILDLDLMNLIMEEQRLIKLKDPKKLKHILFLIDDMISENAIRNDKTIMKLFVQGRHYGISVFVTSQVVGSHVSIPPSIRTNAEYIISFSLFSEPDRKILIERFGSLTNSKEGTEFFKKITQQPYTCCIFDTTKSNVNSLEEMMFQYMAPEKVPNFTLGKNKPLRMENKEFTGETGRKKGGINLVFTRTTYENEINEEFL